MQERTTHLEAVGHLGDGERRHKTNKEEGVRAMKTSENNAFIGSNSADDRGHNSFPGSTGDWTTSTGCVLQTPQLSTVFSVRGEFPSPHTGMYNLLRRLNYIRYTNNVTRKLLNMKSSLGSTWFKAGDTQDGMDVLMNVHRKAHIHVWRAN